MNNLVGVWKHLKDTLNFGLEHFYMVKTACLSLLFSEFGKNMFLYYGVLISGGNSGFHLGGPDLRFSDNITSCVVSNFKETAHFDENR